MDNKYRYDVKNCYYCPGKRNADGTITFDASRIRQEKGLRSIDMQAQGDISKIRADGIDYIIIASNNGYNGTLNFVKLSDQFRQDCLAESVDITTGIQYEDADATPDPFALMGEFKGDAEGIRFIYYNVTATRPNQAGENKDNMREPDMESISVQASPLPVVIDGKECNIVRGGVTKSANAATYNQLFTKVCLPCVSNA
jgi:phi13 family phage major tail protein